MLTPFWYGVYCGACGMVLFWSAWQFFVRPWQIMRSRRRIVAMGSGDPAVISYVDRHGMSESEFYNLPLPEQRRRLGFSAGRNPGPASYMRMPMPTELELDSILRRRVNGGLE